MIHKDNYHGSIRSTDFSTLPEALQKGHDYVKKITNNGASWDNYERSDTIRKAVDIYFDKLDKYIYTKNNRDARNNAKPKKEKAHKPAEKPKGDSQAHAPMLIERIPEEIRFIKRFAGLHGKTKTKEDILRFVNGLQKAILEKRLRKNSEHAQEILGIQDFLVKTYNDMKAKVIINIPQNKLEKFKSIAGSEKVMPSVNYIKRYISLNGKEGTKEKARLLLGQLNKAMAKGDITDRDTYIMEIHAIKKNLENFVGEKSVKVLEIEKNALNGLQGIINGCSCQLNGLDEVDEHGKPAIMNSMDFANLHFDTLGFKGKWRELIGDPSTNFTMMVFGKPKMGKSFLCVDFAGYLARNHGVVLYVAREEGLDKTLQDKLNDKDVKHENLYVSSVLPANLSLYNFVILDSVNKLGLTPEDLNRLKAMYPDKTFIFVFQTTKDGKFRGANTFQHDVDSVIEVPERGKAVQYGRFNQGGEMQIF